MARRAISSSVDIDAPRQRVWEVLRAVDRYPEWNPFTIKVETTFAMGTDVVMRVALRPPRTIKQVEQISSYDEGVSFSWGTAVGPGWFLRADRTQVLTDLAGGGTRYATTDTFTGAGVPLVLALTGRYVQRGFDDVARALKARCES